MTDLLERVFKIIWEVIKLTVYLVGVISLMLILSSDKLTLSMNGETIYEKVEWVK